MEGYSHTGYVPMKPQMVFGPGRFIEHGGGLTK